jgi:hypothetical protein
MNRKTFLQTAGISFAMSPFMLQYSFASKRKGFFTIRKVKGRYFLIQPDGNKFFSIGINHVDPAGLRYLENKHIWHKRYGNSMEYWLKESVRKNLRKWGFNTLGWNQEVVVRSETIRRHSRSFTPEEYKWLDMPYCHMLPFADFHQWDVETIYPDFYSKGFEEWCDYVARDDASRLADDPNLIGYFYIDCPTWIHIRKDNEWKGPLFDPDRLKTETGRKELFNMATQYYKVTHEAIRRYDKNHLILGDRYDAKRSIAREVIMAAKPYVDVLCFQHFAPPEDITQNLNRWHQLTGMPTLVADSAQNQRIKGTEYKTHHPEKYQRMFELLKNEPSCIGYHLCGAYIANRERKKGLLNENDEPDKHVIDKMARVHIDMKRWVDHY